VLVWSALYALPAAVALLPLVDYDMWWHLRTGQWIVTSASVPTSDPFSQYGLETGKPWFAYSWLFEVLAYGVCSLLGYEGIFLVRAVLALAIVAAVHRLVAKREPRLVVAAPLTGLAVLALLPLLNDRPWLFTVLFATLTLDVILDLRASRPARRVWLLPLLFVLWANLHIQFVYGLFLLGLACTAPGCDALLRRTSRGDGADRVGTSRWWTLVAVTAGCTAATLLTPYHVHAYQVVLEYATHRVPTQEIAEFQALRFRDPWDWSVLALGAGAAFALGRRKHVSAFDALLLIVAAWLAFRGRRDIWILVLASVAVITTAPPFAVPRLSQPCHPSPFWPTPRQALAVAGLVLPLLIAYAAWASSGDHVASTMEHQYPVEATAFVREQGYRGPLYNHFNWGGYLIWNLPDLPVSMDGRTNLHGDDRIARAMATWRGEPGWEHDPELAAAGVIIADVHAPLTSLLRRDGRFRVVHEDPVAVVFAARAAISARELGGRWTVRDP
jgi:hypothetical protein